MAKTIVQKIVFKNTKPKDLYNLYIDAKKHSNVTGDVAKISAKEGSAFSVFSGYAKGKNLRLVKDKLIVQTWRNADWQEDDADSIFTLSFEQSGRDTIAHATHANVPDHQVADINKGWHDYYWKPWKKYLAGK